MENPSLLPPIPASPAGPLTRAGHFCVSPSTWLLTHRWCPRCPYMGRRGNLAGGNPEFLKRQAGSLCKHLPRFPTRKESEI